MGKRALALGGGGARGPYHIGVWRALNELGIDYQIVTGTSVGAINGAFFAQRNYETAKALWETLKTSDVIAEIPGGDQPASQHRRSLLSFLKHSVERGGMDVSPLEETLRNAIDEDSVRKSDIAFGIVTTLFPEIKPALLRKEDIPQGMLVDYILASAACFPFFQQRSIGDKKYVDGAYYDNVPANFAADCGADEIIAVDLRGLGRVRSYRHKDIPVRYIRSHWDLGDMFVFESECAKRNMRLGYQDTMKAYRRLEGNAYAFHNGETARNASGLGDALGRMQRRSKVSLLRDYGSLPKIFEALTPLDHFFATEKNSPYTVGRAITTAAEITAELLGVSPDNIYTFGHFNRIILERSAFLRHYPVETPPESPHHFLRRIYRLLKTSYETQRLPDQFWGLATLSPRSFIAAHYILTLEIYVANL